MPKAQPEFRPLRVAVITVSDTRTLETDTSGGLAQELLEQAGHAASPREIVRDDLEQIRATLRRHIQDAAVDVVVATGGTGITARDVTPEALAPLVTKPIVGFGELFRMLSFEEIGPATIQSRAEAALCDTTLVFVLPGSTGAVRLAMEKIIVPQLDSRTRPCNFSDLLPRTKAST